MRCAGIELAGNSNQTLVAIQNTAMRLSQHSDGGGTEVFSGSDSGRQSRPNIAMAVRQGIYWQRWYNNYPNTAMTVGQVMYP